MKKIISFIFIFIVTFSLYSQELFIYGDGGKKEYFQVTDSIIQLKFKETSSIEKRKSLILSIDSVSNKDDISSTTQFFTSTQKNKISIYESIKTDKNLKYINKSLLNSDGKVLIPTDKILVKTKIDCKLINIIQKLGIEYDDIRRIGHDKNSYLITLKNGESVNTANTLFESGYFEYAQPSFVRFNKVMNTLYASHQWALNNTGQLGGTVGVDINAPEAWVKTTGNSNIKVAVIDQGVDLNHPDLAGNLLSGYDATDGGQGGINGSCWGNDAHGTCCAGIIAAIDNLIGIKGVAPGCKIIPIRVTYKKIINNIETEIWNDDWTVDAINCAWETLHADVLSCSWSGGSSIATTNEITAALTYGRNNLGCICVFAAGNENKPTVSWPSTVISDIITVGAMSNCGERKRSSSNRDDVPDLNINTDPSGVSCDNEKTWGSNYGSQLDLIAPGVKIITTDISGTSGYHTGDNTIFNGTSSATPHVSGVAALVLSINPYLTLSQARNIIESTCTKVGSYTYSTTAGRTNGTWNNEVGYGLVNAFAAVNASYPLIIGDSLICNQPTNYSLKNIAPSTPVVWSAYPLNIVSITQNGINATLTKLAGGRITLKATINQNIVITKEIVVGAPQQLYASSLSNLTQEDWDTGYFKMLPQSGAYPYGGSLTIGDWYNFASSYQWTLAVSPPAGKTVFWSSNGGTVNVSTKSASTGITLTCTASNSCGSISKNFRFHTDNYVPFSLILFPNPVSSQVEVALVSDVSETTLLESSTSESLTATSYSVSVVDSYGSTIYSGTKKEKKFTIPTSTFRNGIYAVIVSDGKKVYQNKLVVKH